MPDAAPSWVKTEAAPSWVKSTAPAPADAGPPLVFGAVGEVPFLAQGTEEQAKGIQEGEASVPAGIASGVAQEATGIGELAPGAVGRASARATKSLQEVGDPKAQLVGRGIGALAPGGAVLKGARVLGDALNISKLGSGAGLLARPAYSAATGAVAGAATGLSTPTGDEDSRYKKKTAQAIGQGVLGAALGTGAGVAGELPSVLKSFTGSKSGAALSDLAERVKSGRLGKEVLKNPQSLAAARKKIADDTYGAVDQALAARQAETPWQDSPSGRAFFADLDARISTEGTTTETAATRSDLQKIRNDLEGVQKEKPAPPERIRADTKRKFETRFTSKPKATPLPTSYSEPNVLRETLRKLRDRASGVPETGYDAIDQQRAGDLANSLAKSLADWEPSLAAADDQYHAMTQALYPQGVIPGKFPKELRQSEKTINTLQKRVQDGSVTPDALVGAVRSALNTPSVARIVPTADIQKIAADLDAIEKMQHSEQQIRRASEILLKWGVIYPTVGYEAARLTGVMH